ncbi:MAG: O-antigen ligase family protein [Thermoleophilia bacterium]
MAVLPVRFSDALGQKLDLFALILVIALLGLAALYPETFLQTGLTFGSRNVYISTLLLPVVAIFVAIYLLARYPMLDLRGLDKILLVFAGYMLVRNLFGGNTVSAVQSIVYGAGIYFMVALLSRNAPYLKVIVAAIVALALLVSIYGVIEYGLGENMLYQDSISEAVPEAEQGVHRAGSTLAHPVSFAAFLVQVIPFCVLVVYAGNTRRQKIFGMSALLLSALALLLTFSKGSWIVSILVAVFGGIFLARRLGKKRVLTIAAMVAAATIVAVLYFWQDIYTEASWRTSQSVEIRLNVWGAALEGIRDNLFFGVGFRNSQEALTGYLTPYWLHFFPKPAVDNNFLNTFLEEGLIGLGLWLAFLSTLVFAAIKKIRESPVLRPLMVCSFISVLLITLNGLTFEAMLIFPNSLMFWIAAGLMRGEMTGGNGVVEDRMAAISCESK